MSLEDPLLRNPPVRRAAYSDRTAWLMALLSQATYIKFEGETMDLVSLASRIAELAESDGELDPPMVLKQLETYQAQRDLVDADEHARLVELLGRGDFDLIRTFDDRDLGTQAYLVHRRTDDMLVLAFRGTEKDLQDIRTDLNARFYRRGGTRTHRGFLDAWQAVADEVVASLRAHDSQRIFVTGHSLGGALAVIATAHLSQDPAIADRLAACYTFGGPRVGDLAFGQLVKAPIYRLVHAADIVPRLPFAHVFGLVAWFSRLIPWAWLARTLERIALSYHGYAHFGDMRYLTGAEDIASGLQLLQNPGEIERLTRFIGRVQLRWNTVYEDHSIARYCHKLGLYAASRQ
jgi:triacylglycerol lipase